MKITIYELLGMIKSGKAPKKIKVYGKIYINNNCNCYLDEKDKSLCDNVEIPMFLNDEVEILEEEKKIPKKLNKDRYIGTDLSVEDDMFNKINEIIDYLENKGNE